MLPLFKHFAKKIHAIAVKIQGVWVHFRIFQPFLHRKQFCDFLFAFLVNVALQKWNQTLKNKKKKTKKNGGVEGGGWGGGGRERGGGKLFF